MSKEAEIEELLIQGISPTKLIERGYKKHRVYDVNKKVKETLGQDRKKIVKLEYVIAGLLKEGSKIKMTLGDPVSPLLPEQKTPLFLMSLALLSKEVELYLSYEEYRDIGSPPLLAKIIMFLMT